MEYEEFGWRVGAGPQSMVGVNESFMFEGERLDVDSQIERERERESLAPI